MSDIIKYLAVNLGNMTGQTHLGESHFCINKIKWSMVAE